MIGPVSKAMLIVALVASLGGCEPEASRSTVGAVEFEGRPGSGEPNLHATADGRAILTWLEPTEDGHALRFAVRDAGAWSGPRTVVSGRDFFVNWADFPSLIEFEDGTWIVHWLESVAEDPYAYHVKMSISADRGGSWGEPFSPHRDDSPTEHGFVSMVPWRGGAAVIWLDGRKMVGAESAHGELDPGEMSLRATTLRSSGVLGADVLLDGRVCECCQTALARAGDDLVAAYRDRSPEEIRNIAVVRFAHAEWSEPLTVHDDGWYYPGCPVNGPQLSALGDTVAVAWFTAPENAPAVFAAFSMDAGRSFTEPIRIDRGDPLGRVDIELLPDGRAVVVWLERTEQDAEILARTVTQGGHTSEPILVSRTSESRGSGFPRMARVGDAIVVAWTLMGDSGGVRATSLEFARD